VLELLSTMTKARDIAFVDKVKNLQKLVKAVQLFVREKTGECTLVINFWVSLVNPDFLLRKCI